MRGLKDSDVARRGENERRGAVEIGGDVNGAF